MKKILISPLIKKNKFNDLLFSVENNWYKFFRKKNINLITFSPNAKLIKNDITSVILPGGNDLTKFLNSKENIMRKKNDLKILKYALKKNIPILAVCYGFQLIAEKYGSNIIKIKNHIKKTHLLSFNLNDYKKIYVNSFHNYGVFKLPRFFNKIIRCKDGSIEFASSKKKKIMCMMFHPERSISNKSYIKNLINKHLEL